MLIRISDKVWNLYRKSCALFNIKGDDAVLRTLEQEILDISLRCLEDGKRQLTDDCPEAYVQREIGIAEEQRKKLAKSLRKK